MKNSFIKAIHDRWQVVLPEFSMSAKPLPFLASKPKFKTVVRDKEPGNWYLFLPVCDKGTLPGIIAKMDSTTTILELKCRMFSGTNDSLIIDKTLTVKIFNEPLPHDQLPLKRLPAYPAAFLRGFDSIAAWLFQPEPIDQKLLLLIPAAVFEEIPIKEKPINALRFVSTSNGFHHLSAPPFSFNTQNPKYEKTDAKRNIGVNFSSGLLTLISGLRTNKSRLFEYTANFSFEEGDSIFHCITSYIEKETAERTRQRNDDGSYSINSAKYKLLGRYIDSAKENVVTLGADTLATFRVIFENEAEAWCNYTQMWDGTDSTTITSLPLEWNNKNKETVVLIKGNAVSESFTMKTLKDSRIKEFYINDKLAIIIQGRDKPVKAFAFQTISTKQLKLFSTLSSLPYDYFNIWPPD